MEMVIDESMLQKMIKAAVDEAFRANITALKLAMIPEVDDEEMDEIEEMFGSPEDYKDDEFIKLDL